MNNAAKRRERRRAITYSIFTDTDLRARGYVVYRRRDGNTPNVLARRLGKPLTIRGDGVEPDVFGPNDYAVLYPGIKPAVYWFAAEFEAAYDRHLDAP